MNCANCGHAQPDETKCERCGAYFKKLAAIDNSHQMRGTDSERDKGAKGFTGLPLVAVFAILAGVVYFFYQQGSASVEAVSADIAEAENHRPALIQENSIAQLITKTHAARNPIEAARNATVFIETPWEALGSGFIINGGCQVISNRHVMEFDPEKEIASYLASVQFQAEVSIRRSQLLPQFARLKTELYAMSEEGVRNTTVRALEKELKSLADEIDDIEKTLEDKARHTIRETERDARQNGYTVSFVNGEEFNIKIDAIHYAEKYDLAFFSIPANNCPHIRFGNSTGLEYGSQLYTIGNPSGLRHTVTAGVYSGQFTEDEITMLQTDAPINPGNSGGPLITPDGRVVGVNTSILRDAEGIGFAIPIEVVEEQLQNIGLAPGSADEA